MTDTSKEQGIDFQREVETLYMRLLASVNITEVRLGRDDPQKIQKELLAKYLHSFASAVRSDILRRAKEKAQSFGYLTAMGNTPYVSLSDLTALCTEDLTKEEKI